ncbi:TIGR02391 family protein [Streptomyces sp. NPDC056231]|uniref:TIGR02391 family protein n=1 Tax=Streptomyces sp. NPDC056231 TaxID=3345755 RepID=UPI003AAC17EB
MRKYPEFDSLWDKWPAWHKSSSFALRRILGSDHPLVEEFASLWPEKEKTDKFAVYRRQNASKSEGILESAIFELDFSRSREVDKEFVYAVDEGLRARVQHAIDAEDWSAVASLAATYVEDRVRLWSGLGNDSFGVSLMTQVLKPENGILALGRTPGEKEGWHQLGRGFAAACSNVDRHRIQQRDDLKHYAFGVLGLASLILTQLKHERGTIFASPRSGP